MVDLDETDVKILEVLQDNCKVSYSSVSDMVGVPESTVRYRIERLEKRGVITNYIALVDPRKVGLSITAIMMIKVSPQELRNVSGELEVFEEVRHLFRCTGIFDLVSVVAIRDIPHLNELMEKVKMVGGVREVLIEVATDLIKVDPKLSLSIR